MKDKSTLQNKVEAALGSIDNIRPASPSPYFYARVLAKINTTSTTVWEKWSTILLRPSITFASLALIVVINAFVLYSKIETDTLPVNQSDVSETGFSEEYNEMLTSLYDLENVSP